MKKRYIVRYVIDVKLIEEKNNAGLSENRVAETKEEGKPHGDPKTVIGTKEELKEKFGYEIDRLTKKIDEIMIGE